MHRSDAPAGSKCVRIGRTSALASALILLGSTTYVSLARGGGTVRHWSDPQDSSARFTSVGFETWAGIVPAPDWGEFSYRETRTANGEWIKDGPFTRRTRQGFVIEIGTFQNGMREGSWTFWTPPRFEIDQDRSGSYESDHRVAPCVSPGR